MKRVLIFSLAYLPHVGGAELAIKEITDRITDLEFHLVTLRFSRDEAREERIGNVMVHRVGFGTYLGKMLFPVHAALAARRLNRRYPFDALWAMMSYMLFPTILAHILGVRAPYALSLQEGDTYEHMFKRLRIALLAPMLRAGFRNARVVQAISTFLGEWAHRRGFGGPLEIIPNGVNLDLFSKPVILEEDRDFKEKLDKKKGEIFLITTSRLVFKNAVDDVITALSLLPIHIKFLILGQGHEEKLLRKKAGELDLGNRVWFLGYVPHQQMPQYLHAADIFIRPSRSEGMGNSFIEAMAAGLPVIATQEGGIADFLFDAKRNPDKEPTGWAVDKNSPKQIAEAVKDILAHPEQAKRVTENAKRMVTERYDWDLIAKEMRERVFKPLFIESVRAKN